MQVVGSVLTELGLRLFFLGNTRLPGCAHSSFLLTSSDCGEQERKWQKSSEWPVNTFGRPGGVGLGDGKGQVSLKALATGP